MTGDDIVPFPDFRKIQEKSGIKQAPWLLPLSSSAITASSGILRFSLFPFSATNTVADYDTRLTRASDQTFPARALLYTILCKAVRG